MRAHKHLNLHKDMRFKCNPLWSAAVLAILLWAPQTLLADTSTLERIVEAEHKVGYVGVRLRTSSSSRGTRTFEELVIHIPGDASYRKVVSVVGERRSVNGQPNRDERQNDSRQRDNNENRRDRPERNRDRNEWRQVRSPFSEKEIKLIAQNYNLEKCPSEEKIADYETDILIISPKFAGRPTKHIYFARENGAILRVEDLDAEGILREMFVYNRISFNLEAVRKKWETLQKEIKPQPRRSRPSSLVEAKKILKTKPIQPEYVPAGFQLQGVRSINRRENDTIFLEYTDGLVNFTLFEETGKAPQPGSRERRGATKIDIGGTTVYKHRLGPTDAFRWTTSDIHFLLLGAMPAAEMQKVVKSIIHKTKKK
jgi:negative regulator of sigma E activity